MLTCTSIQDFLKFLSGPSSLQKVRCLLDRCSDRDRETRERSSKVRGFKHRCTLELGCLCGFGTGTSLPKTKLVLGFEPECNLVLHV
ncbi:hypothetical protein NC652_012905 [Populus alba x Populus x berolinensis]|nr:hypothetical protein NC652_012905 [Populus alba x Populus x berolinensis]